MERDPRVFVLGEDVGRIGGIFAATRGLIEKFGAERLRDTPISEAAIAACAVGAAITGMRPVAEVQIFDFITHMMDMIVNQSAKFRFMLGGKPTVPLVIRGPAGRRHPAGRAALAEPGGVVHPRARPGRARRPPRLTRPRACSSARCARTTR